MTELQTLLERFRRGPELLAESLASVTDAELDFVPAPGKWSIRQIAAHVSDSELVGADRFRRILAEENPSIISYDQDAWANRLDYATRDPKQSLRMFESVRSETYDLLKARPEADFERTANHSERGKVTLLQLLHIYTAHPEKHAAQIGALRKQFETQLETQERSSQ